MRTTMKWHPASLLIIWGGYAVLLQWLPWHWLLPVAAASCLLALLQAPERSRRLLWKSRWLLLSLAILFVFFTPGEFVVGIAGWLGVTYDGLNLAAGHLSLIVAMLTSLAWLHQHLGTSGLLAGLYGLLGCYAGRDMTIVRLMLVLDFVEKKQEISWRGWLVAARDQVQSDSALCFVFTPLQLHDKGVVAVVPIVVLGWSLLQ